MYSNSMISSESNFPYLNFNEIDFYYDLLTENKPTIEKEQTSIEISLSPKYTKTYKTDITTIHILKS
jgi:hypothetical protein